MSILKTKEDRAEMFSALLENAREGDNSALEVLRKDFRCKQYTHEEVKLVNLIRRRVMKEDEEEREVIDVSSKHIEMILPDFDGNKHLAQLNWIQHLEGDFYLAGLSHTDSYPYDSGSSVYMLKKDAEEGFVPMFDAGWCLKAGANEKGGD